MVRVYREDDVDRVFSAVESPPEREYRDSQGTWLSAREIWERLGLDPTTVGKLRLGQVPLPAGCTLRSQQVSLKVFSDKTRLVWVYHEEDLKRFVAARDGCILGSAAAPKESAIIQPAGEADDLPRLKRLLAGQPVDSLGSGNGNGSAVAEPANAAEAPPQEPPPAAAAIQADRSIDASQEQPAAEQEAPTSPNGSLAAQPGIAKMSPRELAERHRVAQRPLEGRLGRWRYEHDTGYIEVSNPRRNEPKYLYDESAVMRVINALKAKFVARKRATNVQQKEI